MCPPCCWTTHYVSVSVTVSVKNRVRACRSVNAVPVCRCVWRGSNAAGTVGRPASFPRKRVGGAPGVLVIRQNGKIELDLI